jgi:hypothetical protein
VAVGGRREEAKRAETPPHADNLLLMLARTMRRRL